MAEQNQNEFKPLTKEQAQSIRYIYGAMNSNIQDPMYMVNAVQESIGSAPENMRQMVEPIIGYLAQNTTKKGEFNDNAQELLKNYVSYFMNGTQLKTFYEIMQEDGFQESLPASLDENLTLIEARKKYDGRTKEDYEKAEKEGKKEPEPKDKERLTILSIIETMGVQNINTRFQNKLGSNNINELEKKLS